MLIKVVETLAKAGFLRCLAEDRVRCLRGRRNKQGWREEKGLMEEESAGGLLLGAVLRTVTSGALGVMLHPGKVRWNVPCYTFSLPLVCSKPD